ncbi:MAG TPA: hypothetical protein VKV26_02340 [Dehalococcoidia bacterium]|nr:hypothetical protein [Dehalococcoidia bacterium]
MVCADDPAALQTAEVCRRCSEETARYRRREEHDDRYCFEVMRRAIVQHNDQCWETLHDVFAEQMLAWCRKAASGLETEPDELVALAWAKFLRSFTPEKLGQANGAAGVLAYLKLCAVSVAIDLQRVRGVTLPFDEAIGERQTADSPAEIHAARVSREEFWRLIDAHLQDDRERVFMELFYERELKPAEIQRLRPELFPGIALVYSTRRNVHDRLRRSPRLRAWLLRTDGSE